MPDLSSTFVVLGPGQGAEPVEVTPTIYQDLDARFGGFKGHTLVARYEFAMDWPTWEVHPQGDEVVVLMSGRADMVLDERGAHRTVRLSRPGEFVIVPRGTWHTARISTPTSMLFITPGEGTENRET
jgi:mannose-6-phosphate isomerase-like protein (cupin superfamily)